MADAPASPVSVFIGGAVQLREVGSRLDTLATLVGERWFALAGRLDTLPPAAGFQPFDLVGSGARGATTTAATGAADGRAPAGLPRRPAALSIRNAMRAVSASAIVPASAGSDSVSALVGGAAARVLAGATVGGAAAAGARAAASLRGAHAPLRIEPDPLWALLQDGLERVRQTPVGSGLWSVASLADGSVQGAAAAARAFADLIGGAGRSAKAGKPPAASAGGTRGAVGALPAPLAIASQLVRLIAAGQAATARARQPGVLGTPGTPGATGATGATGASPPNARVAAARAPSRLLAGVAAAVADGASADLPAATPLPLGSAASAAGTPLEDDVIAAINRLLVDQAWLRGVDLR